MGNSKSLLLVHSAMKPVAVSESVNVMLTPQFYTLKKEVLPVRWAYQAKKIAPSLFIGLLEEGKHYEYMLWKEGDEWVFLAYDLEMITAFLMRKGFALENISKLFFTQQIIDSLGKPLLLGEDEALVSLDHTAVMVPRVALAKDEDSFLEFNNSITPQNGVALQGTYGSVIHLKQASILTAIFTFFALIFFVEGWNCSKSAKEGEVEMQQLLESYPSLQSKYTRDSISSKYKMIDTIERKKRETIKALSKMIFKGVTLTSFSLDKNTFKADFSCSDATVAKRLSTLAKKEKFNISKGSAGNDIEIEGIL